MRVNYQEINTKKWFIAFFMIAAVLIHSCSPEAVDSETIDEPTISASSSSKVTNLALRKPTEQSSTAHGGVSSRAVDGNRDGNWRRGSITHTNNSRQPYWQVRLGKNYKIGDIKIWNRTNCCSDRLSNFDVFVYNAAGRQVFKSTVTSTPSPSVTIKTRGVVGARVRIKLKGTNPLSLAEVEVFSDDSDDDGGGSGGGDDTNYAFPYAIPKFRDAISKSKFQAPTSSTEATRSELIDGYSSSWFKVVNNDDISFSQKGSSKRSELRFENNWNVNSGSRTAHANLRFVTQQGNQTTFIQIHDDANKGNGPNKPLLRMYKKLSDNRLYAAVKTNSGGKSTTHIDCGPAPSGFFDCDVSINRGTMTIKINGSTKYTRNVRYWDFPSYWKAGVYNQNSGTTTIHFNELTWN